jgi:hypothetical protein
MVTVPAKARSPTIGAVSGWNPKTRRLLCAARPYAADASRELEYWSTLRVTFLEAAGLR